MFFGNFLAAFADDNAEFAFVNDFAVVGIRFPDDFAVSDIGSTLFQEIKMFLRNGNAQFA